MQGKIKINEEERDKIQAIEKLKKEMKHKIQETKANLYALNNEQLQTTTRLTILQNHQLTTELEHQSKQTEDLLEKNQQLSTQIEQAERDIKIHKEMEKELAKRSHFCQKVIKKLKDEAEELEEQRNALPKKNASAMLENSQNLDDRNSNSNQEMVDEEMINFLELKLEQIEKQLKQTQQQYETLHTDYINLQDKLNQGREKYKRAALLMSEFLHDIIEDKSNILTDQSSLIQNDFQAMQLNLAKVRETPIDQLDQEEKRHLVYLLLKQL